MAYFECIIGSGSATAIPLVVTCGSTFAGLTITCSDGTTTLTDTCPSVSPYEMTFNLPNTGTWTVSGTISDRTYSESILVGEYDIELTTIINLNVDVYSAANDTVSYTSPIDSSTHTITTDSNGHATATITIDPNGSSIAFTSSVGKNPSNLSNNFSKSIALTRNTTSVYIMPDGEVMYWYGYKNPNLQNINTANGWSSDAGQNFGTPSFSTNYVVLQGGTNRFTGVGLSTSRNFNGTHHLISKGQANSGLSKTTGNNKYVVYESSNILTPSSNSNITHQQTNYSGNTNVVASGRKASDNTLTMYAWWAETA